MKALWFSILIVACSSRDVTDTGSGAAGEAAGGDSSEPSSTGGTPAEPTTQAGAGGAGVGGAGDSGAGGTVEGAAGVAGAVEGVAGGASDAAAGDGGASEPATGTPAPEITGTTYYVSREGDDDAEGTSPGLAWRTLARVAEAVLEPGDGVLLRRGDAWREQLVAHSSGEPGAPITYAAFGEGARPALFGSDDLQADAFRKSDLGDAIYEFDVGEAGAVNCALEDHAFLRSAALVARSDDPALQLAALLETPGSWWTDGELGLLHLEADPQQSGRVISICVREDLLSSNDQSHLVFRDIDLFETAKYGGGYAARVQGGSGVLIQDVDAHRAGKHHFGAISTDEFVGLRLRAVDALPDQRLGGASPFVSYGTGANDQDSAWIDCYADPKSPDYPSFVMHGIGIATVLLKNLTSVGYGPAIQTEHDDTRVRIEGGSVDGGYLLINGNNVLVDGIRVFGPNSMVSVKGANNTLQNMLVYGQTPDFWGGRPSAVQDYGAGTRLLFNTILSAGGSRGGAIAFMAGASGGAVFGNILVGSEDEPALRSLADEPPPGLRSDHNLIRPGALFGLNSSNLTADAWRELGFDAHSTWAVPELDSNFWPCLGSPGTEVEGMAARDFDVLFDAAGSERARESYDAGAFIARADCR